MRCPLATGRFAQAYLITICFGKFFNCSYLISFLIFDSQFLVPEDSISKIHTRSLYDSVYCPLFLWSKNLLE